MRRPGAAALSRIGFVLALALAAAACATQADTAAGPPTAPAEAAAPVAEGPTSEAPFAVTPPLPGAITAEARDALARDQIEERNTAIVVAFYEMIFQEHRVTEAFDLYGGNIYVQHNPGSPNGREAVEAFLIPFFAENPMARSDIHRVVAEGDLVVLHVHAKSNPVDRGRAVVEIFRVENGRIVEHWDVVQPIPPEAANDNTMF